MSKINNLLGSYYKPSSAGRNINDTVLYRTCIYSQLSKDDNKDKEAEGIAHLT